VIAHREHHGSRIPREAGVTDCAFGFFDQHLMFDRTVFKQGAHAELSAPLEARREIADLLVGNVILAHQSLHAAENAVFDVDETIGPGADVLQARSASCGAGIEIQVAPARVTGRHPASIERSQPSPQRLDGRIGFRHASQYTLHHCAFLGGIVWSGENPGDVEPGVLIEPIAFKPMAREGGVRRVLGGNVRRTAVVTGDLRDLDVEVPAVTRNR